MKVFLKYLPNIGLCPWESRVSPRITLSLGYQKLHACFGIPKRVVVLLVLLDALMTVLLLGYMVCISSYVPLKMD